MAEVVERSLQHLSDQDVMSMAVYLKALPATPWQASKAGDDYGATASPDWRSVNWQPHLHQMEIDGRSVNYVDYGGPGDPGLEPCGAGGGVVRQRNVDRTLQRQRRRQGRHFFTRRRWWNCSARNG